MTAGQLREHIAGCGECRVDLVTMRGTPCEGARELADIAGIEIRPVVDCEGCAEAATRKPVKHFP